MIQMMAVCLNHQVAVALPLLEPYSPVIIIIIIILLLFITPEGSSIQQHSKYNDKRIGPT